MCYEYKGRGCNLGAEINQLPCWLAIPPRFRPLDHTRQLRVACMLMMNAVIIDSGLPLDNKPTFRCTAPTSPNLHFCTSERLVKRAHTLMPNAIIQLSANLLYIRWGSNLLHRRELAQIAARP